MQWKHSIYWQDLGACPLAYQDWLPCVRCCYTDMQAAMPSVGYMDAQVARAFDLEIGSMPTLHN